MIVNGIIYRYRTGIPWRDLPRERYGGSSQMRV
ncbi:transposase [Corynebacterium variabile]